MAENTTNYQCPACTGPLRFDSASGKLCCDYCGSTYDVAQVEAQYGEKQAPADMRGPLGVLLENLSPHVKQPRNYGSLAPEDVPDFISALLEWNTVTSLCFAFTILTAARSSRYARLAGPTSISRQRRGGAQRKR